MTLTIDRWTSAEGTVMQHGHPWPICVSGAVSVWGTMSNVQYPFIQVECLSLHTNSGVKIEEETSLSRSAIMELRRISGLTWDQLAKLFDLTRRSLHFWASGKTLTAANEEHLGRLLAVIKRIDRGNSNENRSLLLKSFEDGKTPFDLLAEKKYSEVIRRIDLGTARERPKLTELSPHSNFSNVPWRPHELVGALQDPIHNQNERVISIRPIRTKRGK